MITIVLSQTTDPIPAVIPQLWIQSPRYHRQLCPHYLGNPVVPITVQLTKIDFIQKMTFIFDPLEAAVLSTMFSVVLLVQVTVMKNKNLYQICVQDSCTRQLVQVSTVCVADISVFFNKKANKVLINIRTFTNVTKNSQCFSDVTRSHWRDF